MFVHAASAGTNTDAYAFWKWPCAMLRQTLHIKNDIAQVPCLKLLLAAPGYEPAALAGARAHGRCAQAAQSNSTCAFLTLCVDILTKRISHDMSYKNSIVLHQLQLEYRSWHGAMPHGNGIGRLQR
jgi:hypothetical protein